MSGSASFGLCCTNYPFQFNKINVLTTKTEIFRIFAEQEMVEMK